jgi:S-adenosylmethionine/arginine decarboxylase-like enzyme
MKNISKHRADKGKPPVWGLLASYDLHGCDPIRIASRSDIREFAKKLVEHIKMKPYGQAEIVHFGSGHWAGYTLVQMIETSLLSAHFAEFTRRAFVDVFSSKHFDTYDLALFMKEYFQAENVKYSTLLRR